MVSRHRSNTGCFKCRQRHKKCDEIKPTCSACIRIGTICRYPEPRTPEIEDTLGSGLQRSSLSGLLKNAENIQQATDPETLVPGFDDPAVLQGSATSVMRDITDKDIFAYLCVTGATILRYPTRLFPASSNVNTFRLGFPMARQIPTHLHALLSVAAAHRRHVQPHFQEHATKHQVLAVSGLREGLATATSQSAPPEWVCGTAAVLCMYEVSR